jgi:hypothetical protein
MFNVPQHFFHVNIRNILINLIFPMIPSFTGMYHKLIGVVLDSQLITSITTCLLARANIMFIDCFGCTSSLAMMGPNGVIIYETFLTEVTPGAQRARSATRWVGLTAQGRHILYKIFCIVTNLPCKSYPPEYIRRGRGTFRASRRRRLLILSLDGSHPEPGRLNQIQHS